MTPDPQHPDIAALVERARFDSGMLRKWANPDRDACGIMPKGMLRIADTLDLLEAALRTLTRPVEDEQTAKWLRRFRAYGGEFEEAASLLARLVRERDHLHHAHVLAAEDAARRLEQATRAEQERDRLLKEKGLRITETLGIAADCAEVWRGRLKIVEDRATQLRDAVAEARRLIGFVTTATDVAAARVLERALAAAAGTEEP